MWEGGSQEDQWVKVGVPVEAMGTGGSLPGGRLQRGRGLRGPGLREQSLGEIFEEFAPQLFPLWQGMVPPVTCQKA